MIDGRRINDAQNGQFDLSNLPLTKDEIERIEVLRGGASALYGADAMGGVINIITKSPTKEPYARVSSSFGRFGTQEYSLSHPLEARVPWVTACLPPVEDPTGTAPTAITRAGRSGESCTTIFPGKGSSSSPPGTFRRRSVFPVRSPSPIRMTARRII